MARRSGLGRGLGALIPPEANPGVVWLKDYHVIPSPVTGVFRATVGLQERFGPDRVLDTPLAETAIVGTAIGMAAQGLKPVAEIQFSGFIYPAMDHIWNHAGRLRNRLVRGEIPREGYFDRVVALRRQYPLVSLKPHDWLVATNQL